MTPEKTKYLDDVLEHIEYFTDIQYLLENYAQQSVSNARALVDMIPRLADIALGHVEKKSYDYWQAAHHLLMEGQMEGIREDKRTYFASMVPVCVAMFPNGVCTGASVEKEYWGQFIKLFQDPEAFNPEKDWEWAKLCGYEGYLRKVEKGLSPDDK